MADEDATRSSLARISPSDNVDQEPPLGKAIECSGHASGQGCRGDRGAHRHQELQPARGRHDAGRDHPCVFAKVSGGQQHSVETKLIDCCGNLPEVGKVRLSCVATVAKIAPLTGGWNKPENLHRLPLPRDTTLI
jgi:hypothetical protein